MDKFNIRKVLLGGGLAAVVLASLLVVPVSAASAQDICEAGIWPSLGPGIWTGTTPDEVGGKCIDNQGTTVDATCGAGRYLDAKWLVIKKWQWTSTNNCHEFPTGYVAPSLTPILLNYGMERKGLCKLVSIEEGYLGGTITAVVRGKPVNLKLKADGKTYVLPLVPGSVVANGDGTYTAQFYTFDPVTGQALVPAGDYSVRCHGGSGSNDGSGNTVNISY